MIIRSSFSRSCRASFAAVAITSLALAGFSLKPVRAQTAAASPRPAARQSKNQAEAALIRAFLKKKYPTSPGSVVKGVEGEWAFADLLPAPDRDPAFVLLRKKGGKWTEATMGTNLEGAGKRLEVPKRLWKKWDL